MFDNDLPSYLSDLTAQVSDNDFPSHMPNFDYSGGWTVSLFPVAFSYLRVHVLSTQVSNNDFPNHLPDLTAQVVAQFPCSELALDNCVYLYLVHRNDLRPVILPIKKT
ncbi:hypothetical protein L3X38_011919 [Prunus dulcis]|uniref:Uncharacterized protein n=1 Tax=Prunus dulcis TaxID=3755 RepID=A0AAD4WL36_PRUDU|nr:hypothetical protein L3X38_011919 [Prunus dulcis]